MQRMSINSALLLSAVICIVLIAWLYFGHSPRHQPGNQPIHVYCAAGLRGAFTEVANRYEDEFGIKFVTTFAGSGELLSKIEAADSGDIYIAADERFVVDQPGSLLVEEYSPIATQQLVVIVHPSRKSDVQSINDLLRDDVRLSLALPTVTAVGTKAKETLSRYSVHSSNLWDALRQKAITNRDKVNAVANDVKSHTADAGIVWDTTAIEYTGVETLQFAELESPVSSQIVACVLKDSDDPTRALHFLRYLTASDRGLSAFQNRGYHTISGDKWNRSPELTLYIGGLMHPAIQKTIEKFERREGVIVNQVPNGCGILVSQIRSGERPDLYFACDRTFMDRVQTLFLEPQEISATQMVIAVRKDRNKKLRINGLQSLANANLKIGLCSPEHSALGELSKNLLQSVQLWDSVKPNVKDWPSTANHLVDQVVLNSLDAAIVYRANVVRQNEVLEIIELDRRLARAVQPIAVAKDSKHRILTQRLLKRLCSEHSRQSFEEQGFEWLGDRD